MSDDAQPRRERRDSSADQEAIIRAEREEAIARDRMLREKIEDEGIREVLAALFDADDATRAKMRSLEREISELRARDDAQSKLIAKLREDMRGLVQDLAVFSEAMAKISEAVQLFEKGELTEDAKAKIAQLVAEGLADIWKKARNRIYGGVGATGISVPVIIKWLNLFGG